MKLPTPFLNTRFSILWTSIFLHVHIFWRLLVWTGALLSLPGRLLNALQRNRLMEMHLQEMQYVLETIIWEKKQLKERLKTANKDRRMMEVMLAELEEEHDQAIVKMESLESELQAIKNEKNQLKEVPEKSLRSSKDPAETASSQSAIDADKFAITHEVYTWKPGGHGSDLALRSLLQEDIREDESKVKAAVQHFVKDGSKSSPTIISYKSASISKHSNVDEILDHRRDVALSQSLFSAILSLLVGTVIWKAEDPCMPLVVALFSVVVVSLKSVIQFFSTIKNRPASDAVALLSFSWFILGTLTYPTLPKAIRMSGPTVYKFSNHLVNLFGFSS
ncbi:Golgin subfamily A member like [Heracleum sosnowskyi]|uniref:Golgin subfamily A member like n=1 Tax=Heracleum sosnowskyi TaxID=360622 RepID=A0AAD8HKF2_9APIA|nr:Golgin subfamily A member like [Heracleum sosnowskyi]